MNQKNRIVSKESINQAVLVLKQGGLVAFPTETYYGLAVDPFNEKALERLFRIKKRPRLKPVLLLITKKSQLKILVKEISRQEQLLMEHFWPGSLTLVFSAKRGLSHLITGNTATVGVRQSPHPVATNLLVEFAGPLTATSANIAGKNPAVCAKDVESFFGSAVDMIIDGGKTPGGKGSTLVVFQKNVLKCLREGCVPFQNIKNVVGNID